MRLFLFALSLLAGQFLFAQIPSGYYDAAAGLTGDNLRSALGTIITNGHTKLSYTPGVWNAYAYTDVRHAGSDTIWDMYSDVPGGTPAYYYILVSDQCGTSGAEGDCYSREHCVANSYWGGITTAYQYSDLHHLNPCDQYVNNIKSNYPLGETTTPSFTSTNGSKVGNCTYSGYTDKIFEPIDSFKGDFAREWFYMFTRYMADMPTWVPSSGSAVIWPAVYNSSTNNMQPWVINLLLSWNALDPVSKKEIDRNNAIYYLSGQGNRNPYIDHPEYVCLVWGTSCATGPTITNVVTSPAIPTVSDPVYISADITDDGSVAGAVLYWGTSPTSQLNSISMSVGTPPHYTTISAIPAQVAGTTVYYKIVATDNEGNSTTSSIFSYNIPQAEPSNHPANFTCGTTTAVAIPLTWTDATGTTAPTGYLIKMSSVSLAAITDPVDGTPVSDGPSAINVLPGVQSALFTGLSSNTAYYFKIYSYSNTGTNINYLTSGTIQSTSCSTTAESGCASVVFSDDFNRASLSPGGTPSMTYTSTLVGTSTAAIVSGSYLRIANGTTSGISYVSGSTASFANPYSTTLSSNTGIVTWSFNFKYDRTTNPAGIVAGSYGSAIVLAGSSATLTSGTGYALVYGNSSTPDPIRLVKYSAGIGTSSNIISSGANDLANFTNYASIKVTYDPSGNNWSLFIRDDGTTAWADPTNGVTTQIGSTTSDNTYTGSALPAFGFVWSHAATLASTNAELFDNFKVSVNTNPPAAFDVTGGGTYCEGGPGVAVSLSGSETGVNYQLQIDDVNTGSAIAGTGSAISFVNQTAEGVYTIIASAGSSCSTVMNGSATVTISSSPSASVSIAASPAGAICTGTSVTFTATPTNGGTTPVYQWKVNGSNVGSNSATFTSSTLANGDVVTCQLTSGLTCVSGNPATSNAITMVVGPPLTVAVSIAASATTICTGTGVTFTATPVNGGIPVYQWKINGSNAGSNSSTFTTSALANGDVVTCVMTSSLTCATGSPATSNPIAMTVNPVLPVSISIAANPGTSVCSGSTVTFTATPVNGGSNPAYQWKKNGSVLTGETNATYSTSSLVNGDIIVCVLTSDIQCPTGNPATSNSLVMTVNPVLTASVGIAASPAGSICTGTSVTFTASPVSGGTSPAYQWLKNGSNVGSNSPTYTDGGLNNGDIIQCVLTSNASPCLTGSPATSNSITMVVGPPLAVSVSIAANPGATVCSGTSVTFTATPTNEGATPVYQWYLNGSAVGSNSTTYNNGSLAIGDVVSCVLTSSLSCATGNPATSNTVAMTVNPVLPVGVSIAASATTICSGTSVTFTATPTNGGSTPLYQWKKNGSVLAGETNPTYTTTSLANGDAITCIMTSSETCTSGNPAASNTVSMTVNPYPAAAGVIAGTATVCQSQYNVAYSVGAISNATGYSWNYTGTGVNITGTTNSIHIDFTASATSGILTVYGTNACGSGAVSTGYSITVNPRPGAAGTVAGTAAVCQGQIQVEYSVPVIPNASFYSWSYSGTGVTINGTTEVITIDFSDTATSGILTVKGLNSCGYGTVSAGFPITVNPLPGTAGSISGSSSVCESQSAVSYSVPAISDATSYTWTYTGTGATINGNTNNITVDFASGATSGILTVTGSNSCGEGSSSAGFSVTVNPVLPASVSIAASPAGAICSGTSVTFTATPTNGGTAPAYQWKVNGVDVGSNSATFTSSTLADGDNITCVITSNATPCLTGSPATSNEITMVVGPPLAVSVSIAADPGPVVCAGTAVTFTATPVNGGTPTYQWKKNGSVLSGETNSTYITSSLVTGDAITCTITSSLTCATGSPATSGSVVMTINANLTPTFTQAGPYCVGETPGTLPSTSNNGITGTWSPSSISTSTVGTALYTFTPNAGQCATTTTMNIVVNPVPTGVTASASSNAVCAGESINLFSSANSGIYTNTSLLSPTGNGGFESGNSFALNGWTLVNGAFNNWVVGTAAGTLSGTYAAYIGDASNYVGTKNVSANHFYRDIAIPAGATNINLSFYYKMPLTDPTTDYLKVYLTTPSYTPVAGTTPGTGYNEVFSNSAAISTYTLQTIPVSSAMAGTTLRLVCSYICDNTNPLAVPAVDNISLTADIPETPNFSWTSVPAGFSSTQQNPAGVIPAETTQYNISVSNSFGCASTAGTTVTVTPLITPAFSQAGPYCQNSTPATLPATSTNGITGSWSPSAINTSSAGTSTYTFTPTAGQCAQVATMNVTVNPTYAFNENHSICNGDSYTWQGNTYTAAGTYTATYTTVNGCDSIYTLNLSVNPTYAFVENYSICNGDSYTWQGNTYSTAGTYTAPYVSTSGCDSIYTLNLSVNPTYAFNESHSICNGDSYTWHGNTYTTTGTYTAAYTTVNGCDSIYTLNLTEVTGYSFVENHSICDGESYTWHGNTYSTAGTYYANYVSINGCDSIFTLNLSVNPTYAFNESHSICNGDSYTWQGTTYTAAGTYTAAYATVNGCDSIYTLNLTVNSSYAFIENHSICNGTSYTWQGNTYNAAGTYTAAYTTVNGCDSVYTLNLSEVTSYSFVENHSICTGTSYTWQGNTYSTAGTYTASYVATSGCDSTYTLNLTVNPTYAFNESHSICNGDSYTWQGNTYSAAGTYTAAYTTVYGCDSIYTLNLTVNPSYAFVENHSICNGASYIWQGNTYNAAGTYTAVYTTVNGCDSIYTLNLTEVSSYSFVENHSICNGDSYTWQGNTYSTAGTYTAPYVSTSGCDSTYTLNLTVNPMYAFNESHSICNGDSYIWQGNTYTAAGTYTAAYTTVNGCDSTYTLDLSVNPTYAFNESHSMCDGESYTWQGNTYTAAGTYTAAYTTVSGCDSIYTLNLSVNPTYVTLSGVEVCNGDTYIWRGNSYSVAGTYYDSLLTQTGCDSVFVLNLTVNPSYAFNESYSMCDGESYTWQGNTYTTAGTYTVAYTSATGCDSTYTLSLSVNPLPEVWLGNDTTICADAFIILDAGYPGASYLWSEGGATSQTITVDSVGHGASTFPVSVTVNDGCEASDTINITIEICDVLDENGNFLFSVYPNPSDGIIYITGNSNNDAVVELTDAAGKLLFKGKYSNLNGPEHIKEFDLGLYPAGVYFLKLNGTVVRLVRQ